MKVLSLLNLFLLLLCTSCSDPIEDLTKSEGGRELQSADQSDAAITSTALTTTGRDLLDPGAGKVWHGLWVPINRTVSQSQITQFESEAAKKVGVQMFYVGWYQGAWKDIQRQINVWEPLGIKTHVVWEPNIKGSTKVLTDILSGSQNAIIDDFARSAKAYGKPFFLRFAHEMNGDWYGWSGAKNGNDPSKYVAAWQYVWNRFQALGATNVIWVWCPNGDSVPGLSWNDLNNYYPGDAYVDWVGVDFYGLMWGNQDPGLMMDKVYVNYGSRKPIMVGETAAADCTHYATGVTMTKDAWITRFFTDLSTRPNIKAFFWFNENKEADWRITSCPSPASQNAYRAAVADVRFVTR
jgi:hypothetical protein